MIAWPLVAPERLALAGAVTMARRRRFTWFSRRL